MRTRIPTTRRGGFTLIELLVVIAIISILMTLIVAGVMRISGVEPEARNMDEIRKLANAVEAFKVDFDVYPPPKIRLRSNAGAYNLSDPLDKDSWDVLKKLWSRFDFNKFDWGGGISDAGFVLEGDQCLVYFLGGPGGTQGLAKTNNNPFGPGRKKYYDFQTSRLYSRAGSPFPSYKDAHGTQPFVYFSSGNVPNGYDRPVSQAIAGLSGVRPYFESANKYHRPNGFQIISAGADGVFYAGGQWTAANASAIGTGGQDDQTSFHTARMGVSGQ